jgi:hypothetical protein
MSAKEIESVREIETAVQALADAFNKLDIKPR